MQLTPVQSSKLSKIGFDEDAFALFIEFPPSGKDPQGPIYRYDNVSPELFDDFQKATSLGSFFQETFYKNPDHPATKLKIAGAEDAQEPVPDTAQPDGQAELNAMPSAFRNPEDAIATAMVVAKEARSLQIVTPDAYEFAGRELMRIAGEIKRRKEFFAPMKESAFKTHRSICAREAEALAPLQDAERALSAGITSYRQEEERRRREEQKRLDAEAKRVADADAAKRAQEAAEQNARQLEAKGQADAAAQVRANPAPVAAAYVPAAIVQKDVPQVQGLSFAADWDFAIDNPELVPLSHEYYTLDERKIRAKVKQMKQHAQIPGVRVFPIERARKRASA